MLIYKRLAKSFPELKLKLLQARMADTPEYYLRRTVFLAILISFALLFPIFGFTKKLSIFLFTPFAFFIAFFYLLHYVDTRIKKLHGDINKEIVFVGRFLLVELESGVPMFQAFRNISENYEAVGLYFTEIIERVEFGTPIEEALNETINTNPSPELRRMLWQVLNSIKTGGAVTTALSSVFDQIVREQQISVKEYGRKLNPLAMFYMMIAIIIPSLGTIMLIILATFMGFNLDLIIFIILVAAIFLVQLMFLAIIKSSRPPVDM